MTAEPPLVLRKAIQTTEETILVSVNADEFRPITELFQYTTGANGGYHMDCIIVNRADRLAGFKLEFSLRINTALQNLADEILRFGGCKETPETIRAKYLAFTMLGDSLEQSLHVFAQLISNNKPDMDDPLHASLAHSYFILDEIRRTQMQVFHRMIAMDVTYFTPDRQEIVSGSQIRAIDPTGGEAFQGVCQVFKENGDLGIYIPVVSSMSSKPYATIESVFYRLSDLSNCCFSSPNEAVMENIELVEPCASLEGYLLSYLTYLDTCIQCDLSAFDERRVKLAAINSELTAELGGEYLPGQICEVLAKMKAQEQKTKYLLGHIKALAGWRKSLLDGIRPYLSHPETAHDGYSGGD